MLIQMSPRSKAAESPEKTAEMPEKTRADPGTKTGSKMGLMDGGVGKECVREEGEDDESDSEKNERAKDPVPPAPMTPQMQSTRPAHGQLQSPQKDQSPPKDQSMSVLDHIDDDHRMYVPFFSAADLL
jgi:hypothetical protein